MTKMEEDSPKIVGHEEDKTKLSIGAQIDQTFELLEIQFHGRNKEEFYRVLGEAKTLIAKGGDWDRKNRLSVYEGLGLITFSKDYQNAADLLVPAINTYELSSFMPYDRFVFITAVVGYLVLDRATIKKSILENSEVIMASASFPQLLAMGNAFYMSNYAVFIKNLQEVVAVMLTDDILSQNVDWWCKEMRIKAYNQIMRSYLSLKLEVFAAEFGVSVPFIEKELETFIAQGRLACQIDHVDGVVMNAHKDKRNELYVTLVKEGDNVVEKVQRLLHKLE